MNKIWITRKTALYTGALITALLLLLFMVRNPLLRYAIDKKTEGFSLKTGAEISYKKAYFSGWSTINIDSLSMIPPGGDTLLSIAHLNITIKPLALLGLKIRFGDAVMTHPSIQLKRLGHQSNYLFLLDRKTSDTTQINTTKNSDKDYAGRVSRIFGMLFNFIPSSIKVEQFSISADIDHHTFSFSFPRLDINNCRFSTTATITDDSLSAHWLLSGILNTSEKRVAMEIKKQDSGRLMIPYIHQRWNTVVAFDSASLNLAFTLSDSGTAHISGKTNIYNALFNHPKISPSDVKFEKSEIAYLVNFGKSTIELDSSSVISFNKIEFNPYIRYQIMPEKAIKISVHKPDFGAQDFFGSLPEGLFTNLEGIRVKGRLSFNLDFNYTFNQPDSLLFNAALKSKGFRVEQFGNTNFTYINLPFTYTAFEKGQPVRTFEVGPGNPDFRTIEQIPAYLKNAIMTSEDGSFYFHRGFIPDAIRASIITNIKEKRFARGGSTISMQLVKNVFLNRNKNITRKLEEMLITWLIESQQLVNKDRMFEVYLNIIETGPMVYGVNEAARFYFNKDVSKLSLAESIYLASIIPKPKWFRYSFNKDGTLRENLQSYYSLVSGKMLRKEWITQDEFDKLKPEIELKGPARELVLPADSIPVEDLPDFETESSAPISFMGL